MNISIIIILIVAVLAAVLSINAIKNMKLMEPMDWLPVLTSALCVLSLISDLFSPSDDMLRTLSFLVIPLMVFIMHTSSLWEAQASFHIMLCLSVFQVLWLLVNLLSLSEVIPPISGPVCTIMLFVSGLVVAILFADGLLLRIRSMRKLLESGTVWSMIGLGVDAVYAVSLVIITSACVMIPSMSGRYADIWAVSACVFAVMMYVAFVVRLECDSLFVLLRKNEDKILESLKISHLEVMAVDRPDTYKDIYDRLVGYFEKEKPFLKHDLTINEVAKAIYSNKLYISRAVNHYTGRNFCQFVNYYRVTYAMDAFRSNSELKITQLSAMSGFNSVVSFNMAFKLFMLGNPGEWCRKERIKMSQKKK